ncbi:MAG TPA: group II truncated hemoglobin [Polyangiaceae bacterium]|nr:group II truncated hemoglobin [Polyangiaceae bacterium]
MTQANPHFIAIGGEPTIHRLAERFYHHMDTLEEARGIRALHPPDLAPIRDVFARFLVEWLGGPPVYSSERGHPRLRRRHFPFPIGARERDAWMLCMHTALTEVVPDEALRAALEAAFFRTADFMRNQPEPPAV